MIYNGGVYFLELLCDWKTVVQREYMNYFVYNNNIKQKALLSPKKFLQRKKTEICFYFLKKNCNITFYFQILLLTVIYIYIGINMNICLKY